MMNVMVTIMVSGGPIRAYIERSVANDIDSIIAVSKPLYSHIDFVTYDMPIDLPERKVAQNTVRLKTSAICGMIRHPQPKLEE